MMKEPAIPTMAVTAMQEIANQAGKPDLTLDTASWLFDKASWFLFISLVVGAISTFIIVWSGTIKERHWDLLREASNEKVASLELETARSNERTATAELETSKLRLSLEKERSARMAMLKELKPRDLSKQQFDRLVELAHGKVDKLFIFSTRDLESHRFAEALYFAFTKGDAKVSFSVVSDAQAEVLGRSNMGATMYVEGVHTDADAGKLSQRLLEINTECGINAVMLTPEEPILGVPSPALFIFPKGPAFLSLPGYLDIPDVKPAWEGSQNK